jgi:hypothetical protein
MSISALLASTSIPAMAEDLVYVAVEPCRVADTRISTAGIIPANDHRPFLVSGTSTELAGQGGKVDCLDPKAGAGLAPLAVSAYVLAVAEAGTSNGVLSAYPSDQPVPAVGTGSTVNFTAGENIGNTTNITLCNPSSCPPEGELEILARDSSQHVIIDIQGYYYSAATSCPDDMVSAGSTCIDKYEASVWDAATGGSAIAASTCLADGSDCGKNAANPIYAQSREGVTPTSLISWYQAAQACANVGKRLPSTGEWQMAASGTPAGANADPADSCNATSGGSVAATGASSAGTIPCVSSAGAFDMVGNVWEWTAELTDFSAGTGFQFSATDDGVGRILGGSYNSGTTNSTQDIATVGAGPVLANAEIGFRCVR